MQIDNSKVVEFDHFKNQVMETTKKGRIVFVIVALIIIALLFCIKNRLV